MIQYWCDLTKESFEGEEWFAVPNYEGYYEYSSFGRIKALDRIDPRNRKRYSHIMKQFLNPDGYPMIELCVNRIKTKFKVHRLIGIACIPNPENKPEINHRWGIKTDNRITELEWATGQENQKHAYDVLGKVSPMKGKFGIKCPNSKKVKCINSDKVYSSITEAARELNLGISTISDVCRGNVSQAYGLTFKFI